MRRLLVAGVILLAVAESGFWLFDGVIRWIFASFSLGPVYSNQVEENARAALTAFFWGLLNVTVLVAYLQRATGWGRRLMVVTQAVNVAATIYVALSQVIPTCGTDGLELFWFAAIPAASIALQYVLWRRFDRGQPPATRRLPPLAASLGALAVGAVLLGGGLRLSLHGIESHAGTVASAEAQSGGLAVTLVGSPRVYYFTDLFEPLPPLRPDERVVILIGQACDSGLPVAVASAHGVWIESIYGAGELDGYGPYTWPDHERLRWALIVVGSALVVAGLLGALLWVG
jgi:hypothetical protein